MKPSILAIVGPTAVGKTDLFLEFLKAGYNFDAIIADSRQVYKYLDIGTGKDLPTNQFLRQKFWLIDVVTPDQKFSSSNFNVLAHQAIHQIFQSGNQPVIVGGTGRYLKDLEFAPETLSIPPNFKLRHQLDNFSTQQLQQQLNLRNPDKLSQMNNSDLNNPRRLIRAIETSQAKLISKPQPEYKFHTICLTAPLQLIKSRISARVTNRIELGMIQEVEDVLKKYPDFTNYQSSHTPGYQEIISYLNHQISLEEAIDLWTIREINYAKRQLTWFRHQTKAVWFDISQPNWYAEVVKQLETWGYGRSYS